MDTETDTRYPIQFVASGTHLLAKALPPAPRQRITLLISKHYLRSETLWQMACATFPDAEIIVSRRRLRWKNGSAVFGCATDDKQPGGRLGVFNYGGFFPEVLCLDGLSEFTDYDVRYLRARPRSTSSFRARVFAVE